MALEAGEVRGRLRIDYSDLTRLQAEAKQTGQVVRSELGGKITGGVTPESIQNTKTAGAEFKKLGAASGAASNEIRASSKAGADSLTALGGSVKNVETALGGARTAARSFANTIGVGLSVAGFVQFTRGVLDAAIATE